MYSPTATIGWQACSSIATAGEWHELPLAPLGNDAWSASFVVTEVGEYEYTIEAWIDRFATWLAALVAKADAGQDVESDLLEGAQIVARAAEVEEQRLCEVAERLRSAAPQATRVAAARDPELKRLMDSRPDRTVSTSADRPLRVTVDPSAGAIRRLVRDVPALVHEAIPDGPAPFATRKRRLPDIAAMGFDVLYLPPVHPIGSTNRKGRNNALDAPLPAIPAAPGPSDRRPAVTPPSIPDSARSTDFDRFVATAGHLGLEVALDLAFQASPDHPWTKQHPDWFRQRPGWLDQVRREPAEEVPGHLSRSTSKPATGARSGTRCVTSASSGSRTASRSSASTIRIRSRSRSGSG